MAKFSICIRSKRSDGFYPVYIRVFHNKSTQYIKTGFLVNEKGIRSVYDKDGKKTLEVSDKRVVKECLLRIDQYVNKINSSVQTNLMSSRDLVSMLDNNDRYLSFTDYTMKYIGMLINQNRDNSTRNFKTMLRSIQKYMGKQNILFNDLTSMVVQGWINSMMGSKRKCSLYPSLMRAVFNSGVRELNDYDYNIIRIHTNPFMRVKIPREELPEKRSVDIDTLRQYFDAPTSPEEEQTLAFAKDVCLMLFCLAGMNAADLYDLKKTSLKKDWTLCYNRKKTRGRSSTRSYTEINIPERIRPLFEKYEGKKEHLLYFSKRYSDSNNFYKAVNKWNAILCDRAKIDRLTTYSFRHSWATIAQNNCGASIEQVAMALVHASDHKITERYIRKDYTKIDELNQKVMEKVFGEE